VSNGIGNWKLETGKFICPPDKTGLSHTNNFTWFCHSETIRQLAEIEESMNYLNLSAPFSRVETVVKFQNIAYNRKACVKTPTVP